MTDATRRERARELVRQFGYRSDCEMSLADIQWLGVHIAVALAEAERAAYERAAGRIIDTHRMGDRDGWLDLAHDLRAQGQEGKP